MVEKLKTFKIEDDEAQKHKEGLVDKIRLDSDEAYSDDDGLDNIMRLYDAGIIESLQPVISRRVKVVHERQKFDEKELKERGDVVPDVPVHHDYTALEREIWYEEPRRNQIYRDTARDKWLAEEGCVAAAFGFAMCGYSLWTFPELCIKYGAFAFCLMYFIVTCFLTVPSIYFEIILGQFCQSGSFHAWKITPIFTGLGAAMLINTFLDVIMNNTRMAWLGFYAAESFRSAFPWTSCKREWGTSNCTDFQILMKNLVLDEFSRSPAFEFFRARALRVWKSKFADAVLSIHPFGEYPYLNGSRVPVPYDEALKVGNGQEQYDINDVGILSLDLILLLFAIYVVGYFILKHRIQRIGTVYFVIQLVGYFALMVPFCYTWLLPKRKVGIGSFYRNSNFSCFFLGEAWVAVIKHSLIASGFGTGAYILIGSHRPFTNRRIKNIAFSAGFGSWITHCLLGACMFMYREELQAYGNVNATFFDSYFGTDPITSIFPIAISISQGPSPRRLSAYHSLFLYGGLVCLSVVRTFFGIFLLKRTIMDVYKQVFDSFRIFYDPNERGDYRRWDRISLIRDDEIASARLLFMLLVFTGLPTLICFTRGGIYVQLFLENYCYGVSFTYVFLIEVFAVTHLWGIRNLDSIMRSMTGYQSTVFYRIVWKFFVPGIMLLFIIHRGFYPDEVEFDGIKLPENCHYIGILFSSIPFLLLLGLGCQRILDAPVRKWINKWRLSLAPQYQWPIIASGKLGSHRTHWLHYMTIPMGFGAGPGVPKTAEEMYDSCKGMGYVFRLVWKSCTSRIYSGNLFGLQFPRPHHPPPTPGEPMEVINLIDASQYKVLDYVPNEKLKMILEEDREDREERDQYLMTKYNHVQNNNKGDGIGVVQRGSKSESHLIDSNAKNEIPDRAETIQMSMKTGEVRRSLATDELERERKGPVSKGEE